VQSLPKCLCRTHNFPGTFNTKLYITMILDLHTPDAFEFWLFHLNRYEECILSFVTRTLLHLTLFSTQIGWFVWYHSWFLWPPVTYYKLTSLRAVNCGLLYTNAFVVRKMSSRWLSMVLGICHLQRSRWLHQQVCRSLPFFIHLSSSFIVLGPIDNYLA
jgi:hypothetical protein